MTFQVIDGGQKRGSSRVSEDLLQTLAEKSDQLKAQGATREELSRAAAFGLVHEGINPTVVLVRRITNLGANDAISRDLEKIRGELGDVLKRRGLKTEIPEQFIVLVEAMADGLWSGALSEANNAFNAERKTVLQERDQAQESERLAIGLRDAVAAEKLLVEAALLERSQELTNVTAQAAGLASQVRELQSAVEALQEDVARERSGRETDRKQFMAELQAARDAGQRALDQAEGNRKYVLVQLDAARHNERDLADRVKSVEADRQLREEQSRVGMNSLREKVGALTLENGHLKGQIQAKDDELVRLARRLDVLESKIVADAEALASRANSAREAAQNQLIEEVVSQARNLPEVFEYCDHNDHQVRAEIGEDGVPTFLLVSVEGDPIGLPHKSLDSLRNFCRIALGD